MPKESKEPASPLESCTTPSANMSCLDCDDDGVQEVYEETIFYECVDGDASGIVEAGAAPSFDAPTSCSPAFPTVAPPREERENYPGEENQTTDHPRMVGDPPINLDDEMEGVVQPSQPERNGAPSSKKSRPVAITKQRRIDNLSIGMWYIFVCNAGFLTRGLVQRHDRLEKPA